MKVLLSKLSDGKVSVLADGEEVCILPGKAECELHNLESAMQELVDYAEGSAGAMENKVVEW